MNFNYLAIPQCSAANLTISANGGPDCLSAVGPIPGNFATDPGLRENSDTAFGEDVQRGYKQTAFFTSLDFDILPKVLTATVGTRFYHYEEFEQGSEFYTSTAALNKPNGACIAAGNCGFGIDLNKSETGSRSRANLTWHITPDVMAYSTFSQGFRPGAPLRLHEPDHALQGRRFSHPVSAEEAGKLALAQIEGDTVEDMTLAVIAMDVAHFQHVSPPPGRRPSPAGRS